MRTILLQCFLKANFPPERKNERSLFQDTRDSLLQKQFIENVHVCKFESRPELHPAIWTSAKWLNSRAITIVPEKFSKSIYEKMFLSFLVEFRPIVVVQGRKRDVITSRRNRRRTRRNFREISFFVRRRRRGMRTVTQKSPMKIF